MNLIISSVNKFVTCFGIAALFFLSVNTAIGQTTNSPTAAPKPEVVQPKFALLIGITKYKSDRLNKIDGCQNNVPLLRETLIKDYGFSENNIVSLMNEQAAKEAIIASFRTHLIENAKKAKLGGKEAVILYYFCGHGSQYPDQDGDENDGKDETFVAYDSRTGNVFDILDDELDDLKTELRPFTSNTTLILESCHSGTGSRGGDNEYIAEETGDDARIRPPYKRKFPPSTDADALTYTEIAASLSTNTAKSESAEYCNCGKPLSLMTKALVQGLKRATNNTTYRSLTREISGEVAAQSRQEPQVEGNRDAVLFGGAAKKANAYIEIEKLLPNDQIIIRAGAVHGLKEGSQISVYSSESLTNTGKDGWLVNGIILQVGTAAAVVQLPKTTDSAQVKNVKITSHVVLAAPIFGGGAIYLALNPNNLKTTNKDEAALQKQIADNLKLEGLFENQVLKLVAFDKLSIAEKKDSKGIIKLRKGRVKDIFFSSNAVSPLLPETSCVGDTLKTNNREERFPAADKEVYYLDDGSGGTPLFGKTFDPADKNLAENITEAIKSYAYQRNLRGLDNKASTLGSQIKVSLQSIPGDAITESCADGNAKYQPNKEKFKGFQDITDGKIAVNSFFQLKIKNISGEIRKKADEFASGEAFHIAVLALTTTGEIKNIYASKGANDAVQDEKEITVNLRMTEPAGIERYVIVISKDNIDFSFYESKGAKRDAKSILERMLTQSGKRTRDGETISDEPDKWAVVHIELNVIGKIIR